MNTVAPFRSFPGGSNTTVSASLYNVTHARRRDKALEDMTNSSLHTKNHGQSSAVLKPRKPVERRLTCSIVESDIHVTNILNACCISEDRNLVMSKTTIDDQSHRRTGQGDREGSRPPWIWETSKIRADGMGNSGIQGTEFL